MATTATCSHAACPCTHRAIGPWLRSAKLHALRQAAPMPVSELLQQLHAVKALAVDVAFANKELCPKLREVLGANEELRQTFTRDFCWDASQQAFSSQHAATIDLSKLVASLQKYLYERLPGQLGAGTYSVVYKARNRETKDLLAIKKLKQSSDGGFADAVIREISILRELKHPNVVKLIDIITSVNSSHVYLVLEYLDCDLRRYLQPLNMAPSHACVKNIMRQILRGIEHVHSHLVLHRDLKPENVLIDMTNSTIKLADFGLARQYLPTDQPYTGKIVTLYYRSPELLLGMGHYSTAVDMWSIGCIMAEIVNLQPLFEAENEPGLLLKIIEKLGTPTVEQWAGLREISVELPLKARKDWTEICPYFAADPLALDLLSKLLTYDPERRISASKALQHPWFWAEAGCSKEQ